METPRRTTRSGHVSLQRGRTSLKHHIYHVTTTTKDRMPVFRWFDAACVACACFENPVLLGDAALMAWVLMPDHVHWLLHLGDRGALAAVVNRLKTASARSVSAALGRGGPPWNRAYHDHALRHDEDQQAVARYIIANPIHAGLVSRVGDYPYWNAMWL